MKRDPEIIRKLLLFFEEKPDVNLVDPKSITIDGHDSTTIHYHIDLMYEAGFLSCETAKSSISERLIYAIPFRLTWEGHEFLDAARSQTIWNKAREILKNKAMTTSFDVLYKLLTRLATEGLEGVG
jgi:hypothetical protein